MAKQEKYKILVNQKPYEPQAVSTNVWRELVDFAELD
jgi:hypothetical protein